MRHKTFLLMTYLKYLIKSGSRHSVHSPFVYTLVDKVFRNRKDHQAFQDIKQLRSKLLRKSQVIEITEPDNGPPVWLMATKIAHSSVAVGIDQFNFPLH